MSGYKIIVDTTTSRSEFNRAYKGFLEKKGLIHCTYCGYHKSENSDTKWYGGYIYDDMETCCGKRINTRYPNWKLVSKKPKQWMKKPTQYRIKYYSGYTRIAFDINW